MTFKEELRKKIPADIQATPEWTVFCALCKQEKIESVHALEHYLEREIASVKQEFAGEQKTPSTLTRRRRSHAKQLDFLQLVRKKILPYLQ